MRDIWFWARPKPFITCPRPAPPPSFGPPGLPGPPGPPASTARPAPRPPPAPPGPGPRRPAPPNQPGGLPAKPRHCSASKHQHAEHAPGAAAAAAIWRHGAWRIKGTPPGGRQRSVPRSVGLAWAPPGAHRRAPSDLVGGGAGGRPSGVACDRPSAAAPALEG